MLKDLMELKPFQLFINSLSHNFQLCLTISRILPLVLLGLCYHATNLWSYEYQIRATKQHKVGNLSNAHEWEKHVHSKAVTIPQDVDTSECNNSQVLRIFIREWQNTNEGLGNGAYRKNF